MGSVFTSSRAVWLSLCFLVENEWVRSPRHLVCGSTRPCWVPYIGERSTFGCELDFVHEDTRKILADPIWDTLHENNRFNLIVRQCFAQAEPKGQLKSRVKAIRVPSSRTCRVLPHAFSHITDVRHVQVEAGIHTIGEAAWQSCMRFQVVLLPSTVVCLQDGVFRRSYLFRTVLAPGCKQFGIRVFEECCSLVQIGVNSDATDQLAAQAQFRPRAFEKCTALRQISFEKTEYDPSNLTRCLPECCFLEAGIASLHLPPDFTWIGPAACEHCTRLQLVDLSRTEINEILGSTFSHCSQLQQLSLAKKLRRLGREAFLKCTSLREVHTPPTVLYIAQRAFAGCTQLCKFHKPETRTTWRGPYAETNATTRPAFGLEGADF